MNTEPKTPINEPSAASLRTARAVAKLLLEREHEINTVSISAVDRADMRDVACLDAAALIDADRNDLAEALSKTLSWSECYARVSGRDVDTDSGPLATDCRRARALLKKLKSAP